MAWLSLLEDIKSIKFDIPFHQDSPAYMEFAKNINEIEDVAQSKIVLQQVVRIEIIGKSDEVEKARRRIDELYANLDQIQNKVLDFERKKVQMAQANSISLFQDNMVSLQHNFDTQIKEINNIFEMISDQIKKVQYALTSPNYQHLTKSVEDESQEINSSLTTNQDNIQSSNKVMAGMVKQLQLKTNAITNQILKSGAINIEQESTQDEVVISDEELKKFYKSQIYVNHSSSHRKPLHIACLLGRLDVVKKLIKTGVDVNIRTKHNWTPLIYAANYGQKEIVQYLISQNADLNIKDTNNHTALSRATGKHKNQIKQILKKHGATT